MRPTQPTAASANDAVVSDNVKAISILCRHFIDFSLMKKYAMLEFQ